MIRKNIWKLLIGFLIVGVVLFLVLQPSPEIPPQIGAELPTPLTVNVNGEELVFPYTDEIPRKDFDIFCTRENVKITWEAGYLECAFTNKTNKVLPTDLRSLVSNPDIKLVKIERLEQDIVYSYEEKYLISTSTYFVSISSSTSETEERTSYEYGLRTATSTVDKWQPLTIDVPFPKEIAFNNKSFKSSKRSHYVFQPNSTEYFKFWWTFPQGLKDEEILLAANDDFLDPIVDSSSWECYFSISPDTASTTGSHTNFPSLYNLTGKPTNIGTCDFQADLDDIRFSTSVPSGGNIDILDHEIVFGTSTADNAQVYFRNVSFSAGTLIYVLMDNPGAVDISTTSVWNSNYQFVGHSENVNDSTSNARNLTNVNGVVFNPGQLGNAANFGGGQTKNLNISNNLGIDGGAITISLWANISTAPSNEDFVFTWQGNNTSDVGYEVKYFDSGGTKTLRIERQRYGIGGTASTADFDLGTGNWDYINLTYDTTNIEGFINTSSLGAVAASGDGADRTIFDIFMVGARKRTVSEGVQFPMKGLIDEIRILNTAVSSDWLSVQYWQQVNNSSYWTAGTATTTAPVAVRRIMIIQ